MASNTYQFMDFRWAFVSQTLVPTSSYQYNHEKIFLRDSEIIDFGGLEGPGGPRNPSKRWGAKPPAFWSGLRGPKGPPDPKNR